jgi:NitT/TauT family transport system substrate-binding protein
MHTMQSRRDFFSTLSAAGAASVLGARGSLADEAPLETTTVRLEKAPNVCFAPQYVAEELLRAEGLTDVRYVESFPATAAESMAKGYLDFSQGSVISTIRQIDAGPSWLLRAVCPRAGQHHH